jgi:hypothetical protein
MTEKKNTNSYTEKLQKLRKEIERGWNGPDSNTTIDNILASKQKKNLTDKNKILPKETKSFHLLSTSYSPTRIFTGFERYCIGK